MLYHYVSSSEPFVEFCAVVLGVDIVLFSSGGSNPYFRGLPGLTIIYTASSPPFSYFSFPI